MQKEDFYRSIVEHSMDFILRLDRDLFITFVNPHFVEFLGLAEPDLLGSSILNYIAPKDRDGYFEHLKSLNQEKPSGRYNYPLKDGKGKNRWIFWIDYAFFDEKGQVTEIQSLGRDNTEQKESEQLMRRLNRELEKKEKEKTSELLEHQKMLQRLVLEMGLAEERERIRIAAGLHDNVGQYLSLVKIKLSELGNMVERDLESRVLTNQIVTRLEQALEVIRNFTFDLGSPILYELGLKAAVKDLCERTCQDHGIQFHIDDKDLIEPENPNLVGLIFQVLKELIVNIIKHSHAGITRITMKTINEWINIEVHDNGIGFKPKKYRPSIKKTTGFGLFNIRERLEILGGGMTIQSLSGLGTTIKLIIPIDLKGFSYVNKNSISR